MRPESLQAEGLLNALNDAFAAHYDLQARVKFCLCEDIVSIAGGQDLLAIIFNLIQRAEARDRVFELIAAAIDARPKNLDLLRLRSVIVSAA